VVLISSCQTAELKKGRTPRYQINEAHLSAVQTRSQAPARLPFADGHTWWAKGRRRTAGAWPQAAFRLILSSPAEGGKTAAKGPGKPPLRLRKRPEFLACRAGEKRRGRLFLVEALDSGDPTRPPRVGLTVTKKVGTAVERNRIRRRIREALRIKAAGDMAPGTDYVIVARREVLDAPFAQLSAELSRRLARKP